MSVIHSLNDRPLLITVHPLQCVNINTQVIQDWWWRSRPHHYFRFMHKLNPKVHPLTWEFWSLLLHLQVSKEEPDIVQWAETIMWMMAMNFQYRITERTREIVAEFSWHVLQNKGERLINDEIRSKFSQFTTMGISPALERIEVSLNQRVICILVYTGNR